MQREQGKGRLGTQKRGCQQRREGQKGRDERKENVRDRETGSSIGLVGTLDPARVPS